MGRGAGWPGLFRARRAVCPRCFSSVLLLHVPRCAGPPPRRDEYDPAKPNDYEEVRRQRDQQRREAEAEAARQEALREEAERRRAEEERRRAEEERLQ